MQRFFIPFRKAHSIMETANLLDSEEKIDVYQRNPDDTASRVGNLKEIAVCYNAKIIQKQQKLNALAEKKEKASEKIKGYKLAIDDNKSMITLLEEKINQEVEIIKTGDKEINDLLSSKEFMQFDKYFVRDFPKVVSDPRNLNFKLCEDNIKVDALQIR
jgi:chromosome segregation ATPase